MEANDRTSVSMQDLLEDPEYVDYQYQIRDEAVNWLVELGRDADPHTNGFDDPDDEDNYTRLHDAIRSAIDLEKFAAIIASDPVLADVLWPTGL